jgi:hypothetical protein
MDGCAEFSSTTPFEGEKIHYILDVDSPTLTGAEKVAWKGRELAPVESVE